MPTEKTQPSCPGSRDLNWTGKELKKPYGSRLPARIPFGIVYIQAYTKVECYETGYLVMLNWLISSKSVAGTHCTGGYPAHVWDKYRNKNILQNITWYLDISNIRTEIRQREISSNKSYVKHVKIKRHTEMIFFTNKGNIHVIGTKSDRMDHKDYAQPRFPNLHLLFLIYD
jgi:hypothetical protein